MNQDQWNSLIRSVVIFIAGALATKGYISAADSAVLATAVIGLVSAAMAAVPTIWGIWTRTHTAMIQSVNAADNGVKVVASTSTALQVDAPIVPVVPK